MIRLTNTTTSSNQSVGDNSDEDFSGAHEVSEELDLTPKETVVFAEKENKAVRSLRIVLLLVLVTTAALVSGAAFLYSRNKETETFDRTFTEQAGKVLDAFQANAVQRLTALESFSQQITSFAIATNATFPFVTFPDFERQGTFVLKLSNVVAIIVYPIVTTELRQAWEAYSWANQNWTIEGLSLQNVQGSEDATIQELNERFDGKVVDHEESQEILSQLKITPVIFKVAPGTSDAAPETSPGPYTPMWQQVPAIPATALVNFNAITHPTRNRELHTIMENERVLVSAAADLRDNDPLTANRKLVMNLYLNRWKEGEFEYEEGPVSDIYVPIFDGYGPDRKMGAVYTAYIYWQSYFADILPANARGIVVVLANTCGQAFSYVINGREVTYLGQGDLHERRFNHLGMETDFGAYLGVTELDLTIKAHCYYKISVYPSNATESEYLSNQPMLLTILLVSVFIFTSMFFICYDWLVARRHHVVNATAVSSTMVVSSLFPEQVRDRLYNGQADKKKNGAKGNFLASDLARRNPLHEITEQDDSEGTMPIADLYPDCTVYFADIAGFTKWSSTRQPTEVFLLLETLYGSFDKIAMRRNIFKVETVGDCYVAVTGLPQRQDDHAICMCLFAAECLMRMNDKLHQLTDRLGAETATLSMRAGLHSGPVTAGVLRGAKARFQLFGDTVNTAARMESNGQKGRIHVSETTAELLRAAGKESWISKREDLIEAKGKGMMQTYWVIPELDCARTARTGKTGPDGRHGSMSHGITEDSVSHVLPPGETFVRDGSTGSIHSATTPNPLNHPEQPLTMEERLAMYLNRSQKYVDHLHKDGEEEEDVRLEI